MISCWSVDMDILFDSDSSSDGENEKKLKIYRVRKCADDQNYHKLYRFTPENVEYLVNAFWSIWWESRRRIEQHIKNANVPSIHERSRISGKSGCVHSVVIKFLNKVKLLSSSRSVLVATKVLIRAQYPEPYGACATESWRNQMNGSIFHRASKNLKRQNGSGGIVATSHVLSVQLIARWFQLRSPHIEATTTYVGKIFLRSMYKLRAMQMTCLPA